ncbi:hypothetical protein F5X68DRAFT_262689 [Plectosphaerella plurivora]|uniref:Uncharacterized protein n=1 Tax=Plectosphaerella plurivora TaxID=936078 RepID=A0A9P8V9R3_9PEZI|nr:hypothetical protein F5X68DRAFT_262689 [Plectosphaerella plurivora]
MDDDLAYAWPAWKFGMKRGDLFTTLHDRYNTFSSTIQDPEAFHHDVYEIASDARTEDEFHRLLADRRQQRVDELNDCLQSAACEIIANPKLIGTDQWSYALQLFRTRSLDSLVRYFASYLPEGYLDRHSFHDAASTVSSFADGYSEQSESTDLSSVGDVDDVPSLFPDDDEETPAAVPTTREPLRRITTSFKTSTVSNLDVPLSPRSMTSHEDESSPSSPSSSDDHHDYIRRFTPARSMSFSGSESDGFGRRHLSDDEASNSDGHESIATSVSDLHKEFSTRSEHIPQLDCGVEDEYEDFSTAQLPFDMFDTIDTVIDSIESETPTPRPDHSISSFISPSTYLDADLTPSSRRRTSPLRDHASKHYRNTPKSSTLTPATIQMGSRRSPEEASSRISKPLPDTTRTRTTRGRRRALD